MLTAVQSVLSVILMIAVGFALAKTTGSIPVALLSFRGLSSMSRSLPI